MSLTQDRNTAREIVKIVRPSPISCPGALARMVHYDSCFALFTGYGCPQSAGAAVLGLFCLNVQQVRLRQKPPPLLAAARWLLTLASAKRAKHEYEDRATIGPLDIPERSEKL